MPAGRGRTQKPAIPAERQVIAGGEVIAYRVIRSAGRVRTVGLRLGPDHSVVVRAPLAVSEAFIAEFVSGRAAWIRARRAAEPVTSTAPPLADGDTVPFLGQPHTVHVVPGRGRRASLTRADGAITIALPAANAPGDIERAVVRWLTGEAQHELTEATVRWGPRLGVSPKAVLVRNQRTRWGSCAADGVIRYNWRLVLLAPELMDFVVVHELAHLLEANHSPHFWAHVERLLPDYRERRKALNASRAALPAFAR